MKKFIVFVKDYTIADPDNQMRYLGTPCDKYSEAMKLAVAHHHWGCDIKFEHDKNGGTYGIETSSYTGEVVMEFFIKYIEI